MRAEVLARELARLCSGSGILHPQIAQRIGPTLAEVSGCEAPDDLARLRQKITNCVLVGSNRLTEQDALVVRVALNLGPECTFRFFKDRLECLGKQIEREERTARRRVDDALGLLAEQMLLGYRTQREPSQFAPGGWYFDQLQATVELSEHEMVLTEHRRVVATMDGLSQLTVGWSTERVEQYDPRFSVELLSGGRLERVGDPHEPGLWTGHVMLSEPLQSGQVHEYVTRVRQSPGAEPHYIITPFRRIDRFEVSVRFDVNAVPGAWRIDGEPARFAVQAWHGRERLDPLEHGLVATQFDQLERGLSYGISWA